MKFTVAVIALFATLFVVAAHGGSFQELEPIEFEFDSEDVANFEVNSLPRGLFNSFYTILKTALKTLRGLNCTIKEVMKVRDACLQFLENTKSCSVQVTKDVQAVIDSVNAILSTCNDIINLNTNVCGNGEPAENDNDVPNGKTGNRCFWKLLKKILTLKKQIEKTKKLINALPSNTNSCFTTTCTDLTNAFDVFPANIKSCSKL